VVVRSNGDLYFTDPPFGLPLKAKDPNKELASAAFSVFPAKPYLLYWWTI
jgi:hypothetical protein